MSTNSTTLTVQTPPVHVVLRRTPLTQDSLSHIIISFGAIFTRHGTEKDILSKQLRESGKEVIVYAMKNLGKPFDEFLQGAIEKIEIVSRILFNGRTRFVDPWLVEGAATWEKSVLDTYLEDEARFSNERINAVPHGFAKEVLAWLDALPIEIRDPIILLQASESSNVALPQAVRDYQRYQVAKQLLERTKQNQLDVEHIQMLEKIKAALEQEVSTRIDSIKENCRREEQCQQEHHKHVNEKVSNLEAQQQETLKIYKQNTKELQALIDDVSGKLDQARAHMDRQQSEIANLWNQLVSCSNRINDLEDRSSCVIQ